MKRTRFLMVALLLATAGVTTFVHADETITVNAQSSEISAQLDLRMVANLFARSKDLEEFEQVLNNPDSAFSNLDLNGDGQVDYLRVIETNNGNQHLIVLQAILAKDIYQDVATISVEKDAASGQVKTKVAGDVTVYGVDYVIEPVFYYRPLIYDWFWGPAWVCWHSPWYWGYYPVWWHPFAPCPPAIYWDHCYAHHHCYGGVSYHCSAPVRRHDAHVRDNIVAPHRDPSARQHGPGVPAGQAAPQRSRTFGSTNTSAHAQGRATAPQSHGAVSAQSRGTATTGAQQGHGSATASRPTATQQGHGSATASRSTTATASRPTAAQQGSTAPRSTTHSSATTSRSTTTSTSSYGGSRSSGTTSSYGGSRSSGTTYGGGSHGGGSTYGGGSHGGGGTYGGGSHGGGGGGGGRRR